MTHAKQLADEIAEKSGTRPLEVMRDDEGTSINGLNHIGQLTDD